MTLFKTSRLFILFYLFPPPVCHIFIRAQTGMAVVSRNIFESLISLYVAVFIDGVFLLFTYCYFLAQVVFCCCNSIATSELANDDGGH